MLTRMGKAPLIAACFLTAPAMSMPYAYHALAGPVDAVNKAYAGRYKYLNGCTRDEIKRASEIGCVSVKTPVAACEAGECKVRMLEAAGLRPPQ
jgi:hypothetical protein